MSGTSTGKRLAVLFVLFVPYRQSAFSLYMLLREGMCCLLFRRKVFDTK